MKSAIGEGLTRKDHGDCSNQLYSMYGQSPFSQCVVFPFCSSVHSYRQGRCSNESRRWRGGTQQRREGEIARAHRLVKRCLHVMRAARYQLFGSLRERICQPGHFGKQISLRLARPRVDLAQNFPARTAQPYPEKGEFFVFQIRSLQADLFVRADPRRVLLAQVEKDTSGRRRREQVQRINLHQQQERKKEFRPVTVMLRRFSVLLDRVPTTCIALC